MILSQNTKGITHLNLCEKKGNVNRKPLELMSFLERKNIKQNELKIKQLQFDKTNIA